MITEEAIRRTISTLGASGLYEHGLIADALTTLLYHQSDIDEEEAKKHERIIDEINPQY